MNVNWGDAVGDTSTVTATANEEGVVTITASHTFAVDSFDATNSVYQVQLTITGGPTTLNTTVPVEVTRPASFLVVANVPADGGNGAGGPGRGVIRRTRRADGDSEFDARSTGAMAQATTESLPQEMGPDTGLFAVVASHSYSSASTICLSFQIVPAMDALEELTLANGKTACTIGHTKSEPRGCRTSAAFILVTRARRILIRSNSGRGLSGGKPIEIRDLRAIVQETNLSKADLSPEAKPVFATFTLRTASAERDLDIAAILKSQSLLQAPLRFGGKTGQDAFRELNKLIKEDFPNHVKGSLPSISSLTLGVAKAFGFFLKQLGGAVISL